MRAAIFSSLLVLFRHISQMEAQRSNHIQQINDLKERLAVELSRSHQAAMTASVAMSAHAQATGGM